MKLPESLEFSCFFVMLPKDQFTGHQLVKSFLSPLRKIFKTNLLDIAEKLKKIHVLSCTTFEENGYHI